MRLILLSFLTLRFFFTPGGGLSEESSRQYVSLDLQESSVYFRRSQQCSSLDGLDSSSDFQFF